eukprot:m.709467 g.709467  ORF g.709467 m.709467 type:complete len:64 (+) comp22944_c0_seq10:2575-2766(+)
MLGRRRGHSAQRVLCVSFAMSSVVIRGLNDVLGLEAGVVVESEAQERQVERMALMTCQQVARK